LNGGLPILPVQALVIDPVTPTTLYAGTAGGGVYKSTDGGASWSALNNGLADIDVEALAIDPVTPSIIYAGTLGGGVSDMQQVELKHRVYLPLILRAQ
jgi:hypothetical protein